MAAMGGVYNHTQEVIRGFLLSQPFGSPHTT